MTKYRYDELTWPEMREAIGRGPVVMLPFGTVEDHGPHLPLCTDNTILEAICQETARRAAGDVLLMPLVAYGLDEHHMDFPGAVTVDIETLVRYVADVAISAARHGFSHLLIVNGHGSNAPIADLAARKVVLETGAVCGAMSPNAAIDPTLAEPTLSEMRRSEPGGVGHAGEFETALMLHLRPDLVQMEQAVKEMGQVKKKGLLPAPLLSPEHQKSGSVALRQRVLGDARGGKVVVELTCLHDNASITTISLARHQMIFDECNYKMCERLKSRLKSPEG